MVLFIHMLFQPNFFAVFVFTCSYHSTIGRHMHATKNTQYMLSSLELYTLIYAYLSCTKFIINKQ